MIVLTGWVGGLVGWLSSMSSQLNRVTSEQCVGGKIGRC